MRSPRSTVKSTKTEISMNGFLNKDRIFSLSVRSATENSVGDEVVSMPLQDTTKETEKMTEIFSSLTLILEVCFSPRIPLFSLDFI